MNFKKSLEKNLAVFFFVVLMVVAVCSATPIEAGTGSNSAAVHIEWKDGFMADFQVNFDAASVTGTYLVTTLQSDVSSFEIVTSNYGTETNPNLLMDSISYNGHINSGYISGADWWHYWTNDGSGWISSSVGMSDRTVADGDADAWIYGSDSAPVPEPATIAVLLAGAGLLRRRKR